MILKVPFLKVEVRMRWWLFFANSFWTCSESFELKIMWGFDHSFLAIDCNNRFPFKGVVDIIIEFLVRTLLILWALWFLFACIQKYARCAGEGLYDTERERILHMQNDREANMSNNSFLVLFTSFLTLYFKNETANSLSGRWCQKPSTIIYVL